MKKISSLLAVGLLTVSSTFSLAFKFSSNQTIHSIDNLQLNRPKHSWNGYKENIRLSLLNATTDGINTLLNHFNSQSYKNKYLHISSVGQIKFLQETKKNQVAEFSAKLKINDLTPGNSKTPKFATVKLLINEKNYLISYINWGYTSLGLVMGDPYNPGTDVNFNLWLAENQNTNLRRIINYRMNTKTVSHDLMPVDHNAVLLSETGFEIHYKIHKLEKTMVNIVYKNINGFYSRFQYYGFYNHTDGTITIPNLLENKT